MSRKLLVLVLPFVAFGCKDPPAGAADASPAAAAASLSLPAELQTPPSVCALKTEHLLPLTEMPMSASGAMTPFAKIGTAATFGGTQRHPRGELGLTADEDLPFVLRVVSPGAEVRGFVPRTTTIHASGPVALGKFAAALPHTSMRVARATMVEVEVEAELGSTVESLEGPLKARGPCGLFAIERRDFNATQVIPGVKWKDTADAYLKRGKKIPLTTLPLGEPSARIELGPKDEPGVVVFERQNARAHIAWLGGSVLIHGWIDESELVPLPKTAPSASGSASAVPSAAPSASPSASAAPPLSSPMSCPDAVPLVVQTGSSRTTVGTLRASGAFEVLGREKGWAEVRVEIPLLVLAPGARLFVRESDLAPCKPKKEDTR